MMINTILFEIILFALSILSPDIENGKIEIIIKENHLLLEFHKKVEVFDEDHKIINYYVDIKSDKDDGKITIEYIMIDNALYNTVINKNNAFEINLVPYYSNYDWKNVTKKKQRIKDTNNKTIIINPGKKFIEITSASSDITIKIPKEYFKNNK